ncbi:S8 family peptidase [Phaeodactylibacter sp.]|uniref:S8 family peptidase n=2 Tax=Phaeodactylibacter sp. TaxID=1940289 RepID=UPI0025DB4650|nr:S8 family peptidase [Phaeodactylibacter sp.]MCI5090843.1 S8 family peptidase [Phaeodactylibacter sp.]
MSKSQYSLIFIKGSKEDHSYTSPQSGGPGYRLPTRNRRNHGDRLLEKLNDAWREFEEVKNQREAVALPVSHGIYLEFKSRIGFDLVTKSLENIKQGIRLLNVKSSSGGEQETVIATVYIPAGKENYFISKVQAYLDEDTSKGNPKNAPLVESIENVQLAIFESFWQDSPELIPEQNPEWCEVWIRTNKRDADLVEFVQTCTTLGIEIQNSAIFFPERTVVLVKADKAQLTELFQASDKIAEYRRARETVRFFVELNNVEQTEWVEDIRQRIELDEDIDTSIYILDTGINNGHRLIELSLSDEDLHSYLDDWGVHDHKGHGTNMAGVAIFGDLSKELQSQDHIELKHVIESGKILPPTGENEPKLYGFITQQLVSKAEIQAPERKRIICMAVTTDQYDQGKPSSWSGAIDSLTSGADDGVYRLIILSAGNVPKDWGKYPEINLISSVHSPSQSWNAISVGAFTELTKIEDENLNGYRPLAPSQGLSPFSTTSLTWETTKWPIKPDVLFEGGNVAINNDDGFPTECDDLSVLTTHYKPNDAQFESFCMTSAATAKASWMAAKIQAEYAEAWPETVRGLIIHSADWTETMKDQFFIGGSDKAKYRNLIRACGYGVPNLNKAIYCTNNNLVLIAQESLQPFNKERGSYKTKDMHFYELPWPKEVLLNMGDTPVKLKVTLSYFIEPGPGEVGWKDKYRYRSHGLKFDVNSETESKKDFIKRINKAARDENEDLDTTNDSQRWAIGSQSRHLGSVHSDFIEKSAVEIASCNFIGVYPAVGWWKQRHHLGKWNKSTRYSLIVSLETPAQEVDLYSPVAVSLEIPIQI